jgi:hypothetical protein
LHANVSCHTKRTRSTLSEVQVAHHAAVAVSARDEGSPAARLPYLAPKRQRRAYGDKASTTAGRSSPPEPEAPVAVNALISAMLRSHALDWASTQKDNCRTYLLSPTGRFQRWCATTGIATVDSLTTDAVADFLAAVGDRRGAALKPATVAKYRIHLRALARFQAQTPAYGDGLADIHRIPAPRMPKERLVLALSRQEEEQVLAACTTTRDRLIIELLLATGVRVSELTARPPRLECAPADVCQPRAELSEERRFVARTPHQPHFARQVPWRRTPRIVDGGKGDLAKSMLVVLAQVVNHPGEVPQNPLAQVASTETPRIGFQEHESPFNGRCLATA